MQVNSSKESTMVFVTHSWKAWAAGLVASLAIFGVLYFTVISPDQNTANQAVKTGMKQTQQAITQAEQDVSDSSGTGGSSKHASKQVAAAKHEAAAANKQVTKVANQAKSHLNEAAKLASCVTAAGTDTGKIEACQAKYTG
jgi:hypothetical protein